MFGEDKMIQIRDSKKVAEIEQAIFCILRRGSGETEEGLYNKTISCVGTCENPIHSDDYQAARDRAAVKIEKKEMLIADPHPLVPGHRVYTQARLYLIH